MNKHSEEVAKGNRFEFGRNWSRFLKSVDMDRILSAEQSLKEMLKVDDISGHRFLDIGSGSGLFSLAARRMGAKVCSFDYDPKSVACTNELKSRYFSQDTDWIVEEGNVLDLEYISALGEFDVVYSWGVLHHTGEMWKALDHVDHALKKEGLLFIAIYNKQPLFSGYWRTIKRIYNKLPAPGKYIMNYLFFTYYFFVLLAADIIHGRNPVKRYTGKARRGMGVYSDVVDWIGGYPFEVASPEEIFRSYHKKGYELLDLKTCAGRQGCNEFLFKKH